MKRFFLQLVIFLSILFSSINATAQELKIKLGVGDKMPDVEMKQIVNFKKNKAYVSDFKGKPLILDFWATWCGNCIAAFPKIDSFQKKYQDKIQFLGITSGNATVSSNFLANVQKYKGLKIPSIVGDTVIWNLFDFRFIPHYVWIDANGIITAITGTEEVNSENISNFIKGKKLFVKQKVDKKFLPDWDKPFFFSDQYSYSNFKSTFLYNSIITQYNQEIDNGAGRGKNFIECPNSPIKQLYQIAFGMFDLSFLNDNRIVLEGFTDYLDSISVGIFDPEKYRGLWKEMAPQYSYCYELAFSDSIVNSPYMFKIMQDDLNRYFAIKGLRASLERRKVKVLGLMKTSDQERFKTKGGNPGVYDNDFVLEIRNMPISTLVAKFQASYYKWRTPPIEDFTDYKGGIDIKINADLNDIKEVNRALENYDLQFIEKEKEIDMIVIKKQSSDDLKVNKGKDAKFNMN